MSSQSNFSFCNKCLSNISLLISDQFTLVERFRLWQAESEDDNQNWGTGTKPEKWAPSMRSGVDESSCKGCSQKISESITLLQHTGDYTTSFLRAILQSSCGRITIQTTHCNAEQCSACEELLVGLTEACPEFKSNEQEIVHNEGPLSSISVCCETKSNGANRPEH